MSNDLQDIAVGMHNYCSFSVTGLHYRRLVATGWDKTNDGYAPRASAMQALSYVCGDPNDPNNIGKLTNAMVEKCDKNAPPATGGYSLNYYYEQTFQLSREELLQKAITGWAGEVSKVGKDNIYKENMGFNNFANMMHDKANELTCAVNVCTKSGNSAVACQYKK
ncbi:hypothetical protein ANCCAN_21981 [Ancylostoma caninum]|uniref:SCP domain-containing protein n=1 Tax=Ancylostoma caninum TaxID=29170 RepID=A0A368FMI0_ANCCA|nr:hypothetical protein ANCCAN_21981 [Ancylostoma caninum]